MKQVDDSRIERDKLEFFEIALINRDNIDETR